MTHRQSGVNYQEYTCPGCKKPFKLEPSVYADRQRKAKRVYCTKLCRSTYACSVAIEEQQMNDWGHMSKGTERKRLKMEQERREIEARLTSRRPSCYG